MAESREPGGLAELRPDVRNARRHNPRNIGMIVKALQEVGAARSIVIDEDGTILAGNGVAEAAAEAGIERVQIIDVDGETLVAVRRTGLTEQQKRRLAYFDNRTAELAEWDAEQIMADQAAGFDFDGLFTSAEMDAIEGELTDDKYSRKIEPPIYEPLGIKPTMAECYDDSRAQGLIAEIMAADSLDDAERAFLIAAAHRHTRFNFEQIAEYYAHSLPEVQRLFENSALVIIDFDRAIELGFVRLAERFLDQVRSEYPDDEA